MSDAFDDMFDGPEPKTPEQKRKPVGLVVGKTLTPEEFEARFVNRTMTPEDYIVEFEIENEDG